MENRKQMLKTERLFLSEMTLADTEILFGYWSDDLVTKYMNIEPFQSLQPVEEMIRMLRQLEMEGKALRCVIILQATGEIIGTCGFNYIDHENQRAEIAYDLGTRFWKRGYATEAVQALMEWGIESFKLHRMEAKVDPRNEASISLLEKLGFQEEGLLRDYEKIGTEYQDLKLFSWLNK
ncbi:Putative ribosomal N-acetyltransferase YdaF [Listeria ivanovii subsp. londoniensis]|uniref:GNAT family N-acetyltransferase n=2 Tax=Listeria ivanovii TaxID=1638 RepID=A0ABS1G293_LISIV|nr:GNAT family protein [Listeria ivanovii]EFR98595.1 acetyltransferase [Listeria ivanovii FSL F6-596]AIS58501.1 GNAT family acetyltransferase [Listeria ivanovii subsp. londoniensis]MBK1960984.1 GNAT family N-acetyltransferase [Listeria ivanovii subsp. londoniensis]SDW02786.1 ribosomal-protein-alanine N-acetyltransferase [Listeria ivanovii]VEH48635.1 Putative ribosomal N-acetyltransferase YdaF [Listeria ivanovii subsp. londoniensis]